MQRRKWWLHYSIPADGCQVRIIADIFPSFLKKKSRWKCVCVWVSVLHFLCLGSRKKVYVYRKKAYNFSVQVKCFNNIQTDIFLFYFLEITAGKSFGLGILRYSNIKGRTVKWMYPHLHIYCKTPILNIFVSFLSFLWVSYKLSNKIFNLSGILYTNLIYIYIPRSNIDIHFGNYYSSVYLWC
jgi:hypothetical protein